MKRLLSVAAGFLFAVLEFAVPVVADDGKPAAETNSAAAGPEVTLKGVLLLEEACIRKPDKEAGKQPVLFALEGTPDVTATLDDIMKKYWPGDSMDAAQAIQLNEAFGKRLKYYLAPCELTTKNIGPCKYGEPSLAVTGVVFEKDGKKWITPSKIFGQYPDRKPVTLKYPDKMLAPDKPLQMSGKTPLVLRVTDTLSLKCILLPSGDFLFEKPYYVQPRWQDEFPRHITFTKPLWMAEIPVTQEMWESVTKTNPSTVKEPKCPVRNITAPEANNFCQILSEKNGRKVRLPGEAEWEYAARVGTSNPEFDVKCKDQDCSGKKRGELLPVKSRQPNAWGLYDMIHGGAFEMLRDKFSFIREDAVDPYVSCEKEDAAGKRVGHWGRNSTTYHESTAGGGTDQSYGNSMIRVVVEATPEEIAEMEKAANKGK